MSEADIRARIAELEEESSASSSARERRPSRIRSDCA